MPGSIDTFDWVDGLRGLTPHIVQPRVPAGAPLIVSGWAVDTRSDQPPKQVAIVLDSSLIFAAETGFYRPDIATLLGSGTPADVGFRALIQTGALAAGVHDLRLCLLGEGDIWYSSAHFQFGVYGSLQPHLGPARGTARVVIDGVVAGQNGGVRHGVPSDAKHPVAALRDVATIRGWGIDLERHNSPYGVCAVDESGNRWNSLFDVSRTDVRAQTNAGTDLLGFEIAIPTEALGRGTHRLSVQAFDGLGRATGEADTIVFDVICEMTRYTALAQLTSDAVICAAVAQTADVVEPLSPARVFTCARGDVIDIAGWAYACNADATPREAAQVMLELSTPDFVSQPYRYNAYAGFTRKKWPSALPGAPFDDIAFSNALDTADLTPGTYALSISIIRAGRTFYARGGLGNVCVTAAGDSPKRGRR
jgi:hypothetical protein